MRKTILFFLSAILIFSCVTEPEQAKSSAGAKPDPSEGMALIKRYLGFDNVAYISDRYVCEGDIVLTNQHLTELNDKTRTDVLRKSTQTYMHGYAMKPTRENIQDVTVTSKGLNSGWVRVIKKAITRWNDVGSAISMRYISNGEADITIWHSRIRGIPWDLPVGEVAHADWPQGGKVGKNILIDPLYYESGRGYLFKGEYAIDRATLVIMHELGHTFGFGHTDSNGAPFTIPGTGTGDIWSIMDSGVMLWHRSISENVTPNNKFIFTSDDKLAIHYMGPERNKLDNSILTAIWYNSN